MKKYTYYLGLSDKDTKMQYIPSSDAMEDVRNLTMKRLGGGSISLCEWLFQHDDWTQIVENTIKIESLWFRDESVFIDFAKELKAIYNQESVLLEVTEVDARFI